MIRNPGCRAEECPDQTQCEIEGRCLKLRPTPPQAPEEVVQHGEVWFTIIKHDDDGWAVKSRIPGLYLAHHDLAAVLSDIVPVWRALYEIAPAQQGVPEPPSALATQAEAVEVLRELVEANAQQDRAKTPMAENVAWDRIEAAWSRATALAAKGK